MLFRSILITNYHTWINNAERQIARYELSLEARRRPAVHEAIINARGSMCGAVQSTLAAAGFPHPETQAIVLLSALDGLCHDYLLHARYYVEPAHIEGIIRRWLGVEYDAPSHAYPESDIGAGAGS